MATPDLEREIEALRALVNSGATSTSIDGQSVTIDQAMARKRLRELEAELAAIRGKRPARPPVWRIRMDG